MPVISIALFVMLAVFPDYPLNRLLQRFVMILGRQRKYIAPMTEEVVSHLTIDLQALWNCHAKPPQHDRYETACARAIHVIEVVTWQQLVLVECSSRRVGNRAVLVLQSSFALGNLVHESLEDDEAGVATNTAAIYGSSQSHCLSDLIQGTRQPDPDMDS